MTRIRERDMTYEEITGDDGSVARWLDGTRDRVSDW